MDLSVSPTHGEQENSVWNGTTPAPVIVRTSVLKFMPQIDALQFVVILVHVSIFPCGTSTLEEK
jgi:hypothetical protein